MRPPRLRNVLAIATAAFSAGAMILAATLIVITSRLEETSDELAAAVQSVRIAQQATIELLLVGRPADPVVARSHETRLRAAIAAAGPHVRSPSERRALEHAAKETETYLAALGRGDTAQAVAAHPAAFAALAELVSLNEHDARAARLRAERWDQQADWIAGVAIVLFVLTSGALMWWLRRALRPMIDLSATLERFSAGDRDARAEEAGPVEIRQMARQFNEMTAALRAQTDARTTLLRSVAHDLRSPLTAVRLSTDVFAADRPLPPEPQLRAGLARITRSLARFDRLISDLTDLAQVEAGELHLKLEACDAVAIVHDVVGLYESQTQARPIEITASQPTVPVRADPSRLEQVLGNLLTNAVKYSPPDAPISVSVESSAERTAIAVSDRGPGIRPEERELLFEPYWRGKVGNVPGTGLGLFITRRIVEAHGGTIDVADRPEGGSTFRVLLPNVRPG